MAKGVDLKYFYIEMEVLRIMCSNYDPICTVFQSFHFDYQDLPCGIFSPWALKLRHPTT